MTLEPLRSVLDTIEHPMLLLRSDAYQCVANAAAERLLGEEPQNGALAREIRSLSKAALATPESGAAEVEVGARGGRYRMRAMLLRGKVKELASRVVMVSIERTDAPLPSRASLTRRFTMTTREADVALLLARGASNRRIASELHISPHTARHHTESVLFKLNVHRRAEVARAIIGDSRSDERTGGRSAS